MVDIHSATAEIRQEKKKKIEENIKLQTKIDIAQKIRCG